MRSERSLRSPTGVPKSVKKDRTLVQMLQKSWFQISFQGYHPQTGHPHRIAPPAARHKEIVPMKAWMSGNVAGTGTFRCVDCDYPVSLDAVDELPTCPNCGGSEFVRASLFTTAQASIVDLTPEADARAWIDEVREGLTDPGQYLAYRSDEDDVVAYALQREWTRIGRSLAADIRFDDPTVSRRHALIVRQPDGLRVLDDRSLNGVFVNGERVEWSTLTDGDEIVIGRHRLYFIDVPVVSGMRAASGSAPSTTAPAA